MQLIKYDAARKALQEAKSIDEVKDIRDKAEAMRVYAKQSKDTDLANWAAEIRIRAERRLGKMLKAQKESGGMQKPGQYQQASHDASVAPKLSDMGITHSMSSRAQAIADVPEDEFEEVITEHKEKQKELTSNTLHKLVRKKNIDEQVEKIETGIDLPAGVFEVISIDPPWPYRDGKEATDYDPSGRRAANPYPEMSLDDIGDIELPAADDCVLWLWTTHKFMRHSFDLLDNWGFQDKAILTWVKDRMGLGAWLRSQSEFCIMAVKGKPIIQLTNQTTVLNGKMREHSRKPDEFYEMVNGLCVGRKLDYFSRESREGWEQLGNDQEKFNAVQ